ncbi:hypothetical protein [Methylorubrum extorquens]|uniref:Uncharacterized protein n=1 Tax=Methylorubrum extorquens (strain ATCC 14718 / DSM 1338 / JCM 2805 / NCIMB 9133 / AM1) TaxID=272630 RepID=C5ARQ8_METEA|nr:hypothetical protein [Methylorubrum extorquens]ACS42396.1 Hypothetical protein MexAM1_META1p4773 [Methylorubrum extorquens AM1]MCP1544541.1 hypothetical protein [Methylorubrum extorquens]MCP1588112.1 hypothetical protein [Methylorubrum extorquens]
MLEADDLPTVDQQRLERLVTWHENVAQRDGNLAIGLEAEGLEEAARRNRVRSEAHWETARLLTLLRPRSAPVAGVFRGHLTPKRPARIRAPP